jgi:hypothetical protein
MTEQTQTQPAARECANCGETTDTVRDRAHGMAECAPCYLATLEHGRRHVSEAYESAYVITGYGAGRRHVYTEYFIATCTSEALCMAERDCAGVLDVAQFTVFYHPIVPAPDPEHTDDDMETCTECGETYLSWQADDHECDRCRSCGSAGYRNARNCEECRTYGR